MAGSKSLGAGDKMGGETSAGFSSSNLRMAAAALLASVVAATVSGCGSASDEPVKGPAAVRPAAAAHKAQPEPRESFPDEVVLATTNPGASLREPQIIYFEAYDADVELTAELRDYLDQVKALLSELPDARLAVVGHSDASGARDVNIEVARARARSVAERLKAYGFREDELRVSSRGPDQPLVPNDSEENRARNRRVELRMVQP